jgi:hypothetical protein
MIRISTIAAGLLLCARAGEAQESKPGDKLPCPPAVADTASRRYARVFIDGRQVGGNVLVEQEAGSISYDIVGQEPAELAKLPVNRIDLVSYDSGAEAEKKYRLCPGMVAILITTKKTK